MYFQPQVGRPDIVAAAYLGYPTPISPTPKGVVYVDAMGQTGSL